MSSRTAATTKPTYKSGHCATGHHDNCRGAYAGADCRCRCHRAPPALPVPRVCGECGRPLEEASHG